MILQHDKGDDLGQDLKGEDVGLLFREDLQNLRWHYSSTKDGLCANLEDHPIHWQVVVLDWCSTSWESHRGRWHAGSVRQV